MSRLANGIAHVSFRGGGIFLPARNPYDRELLLEHVAARVRSSGEVQVLLDGERWQVHPHRRSAACTCAHCGDAVDAACYAAAGGPASCMRCALRDGMGPPLWQREPERSAG